MKKAIKRMVAMFTAVMTMAIILGCTTITASAADINSVPTASYSATASISASPIAVAASIANNSVLPAIPNLKLNQQQNGINHDNVDGAYQDVVNFIIKWLKRAGLAVGFFGAIAIFWAMKQEDAEGKQKGILTLIAGFGVAAVCQCVAIFHLFD